MSKESSAVIESIRSGENQKALKYLYKSPLNKIRRYILDNSGNLDDANDVFQDAVVVLFHYVQTDKYNETYDLDGFLFRVAKNAWISKVRKQKKVVKTAVEEFDKGDEDHFFDAIIDKEKLTMFHELFSQLGKNCQRILSLVAFEKKSLKEVAKMLGQKDEKVAKSQHYRCKQYFAKIVKDNKSALNVLRN